MDKRIFISYSWNDTGDINRLDSQFLRFQIRLTRDIRDLRYDTGIHAFMDRIKTCDKLIIYVSDTYLRSVNCMYEASQVLDMPEKVVIILKKGTRLFGIDDKLELIHYWEENYQEILRLDPARFSQEAEDTRRACASIGPFLDFIKQNNRMNSEEPDFDVLLDSLGVERAYPEIVTRTVIDWIAQYPRAKLFDVLALISDLYRSACLCFSEFPNLPDDERIYLFQSIRFAPDLNGVTLFLSFTDQKTGQEKAFSYPHLIGIEENTMWSDHHRKYYFHCENPLKKQTWTELCGRSGYDLLSGEEKRLLEDGYCDTYRMTVYFA